LYITGHSSLNYKVIAALMKKGVPLDYQNKVKLHLISCILLNISNLHLIQKGKTLLMEICDSGTSESIEPILSRPEGLATLNIQDNVSIFLFSKQCVDVMIWDCLFALTFFRMAILLSCDWERDYGDAIS
jgi:hypothetical protein